MVRVLIAILLGSLVSGCQLVEDGLNKIFYHGTVQGMYSCLERTPSELINIETAKSFCASEYQAALPRQALTVLTGRAGPENSWSDKLFAGTLMNDSIRYVVTELTLNVILYGADDKESGNFDASVLGWFKPNAGGTSFKSKPIVGLPDDWGQDTLPYCPTPRKGRCWTWSIQSAQGLEL